MRLFGFPKTFEVQYIASDPVNILGRVVEIDGVDFFVSGINGDRVTVGEIENRISYVVPPSLDVVMVKKHAIAHDPELADAIRARVEEIACAIGAAMLQARLGV